MIVIAIMMTVMVIAGMAGVFTAARDTQPDQDKSCRHGDCLAHRFSP
jgi:hypothetical protein